MNYLKLVSLGPDTSESFTLSGNLVPSEGMAPHVHRHLSDATQLSLVQLPHWPDESQKKSLIQAACTPELSPLSPAAPLS